jgi:phosphatidylserine decarboxylase
LHYGEIVGERVEQVKGITYSLGALLGQEDRQVGEASQIERTANGKVQIVDDEHFATINDISYSLDKLMGSGSETQEDKVRRRWWKKWKVGGNGWKFWRKYTQKGKADEEDDGVTTLADGTLSKSKEQKTVDASHKLENADLAHDASVAMSLGSSAVSSVTTDGGAEIALVNPNNKLHFMVIYLAPGDYHRFHSPTSWVVERRRHFTGDLFSVSPYIANRMKDLFVLNERVALLGRWKHGFYSMIPVGATNVGSIRINFDENLRTNTRKLTHPSHTFTEAVYTSASTILQGQPLLAGEEMGGFRLGSTIVLVFEAPKGWEFTVAAGDKVRVGQKLGDFTQNK